MNNYKENILNDNKQLNFKNIFTQFDVKLKHADKLIQRNYSEEAIKLLLDLEKNVKNFPNYYNKSHLYNNLGLAYFINNKDSEINANKAIYYILSAYTIKPNNNVALFNLFNIYYYKKRYNKAIETYFEINETRIKSIALDLIYSTVVSDNLESKYDYFVLLHKVKNEMNNEIDYYRFESFYTTQLFHYGEKKESIIILVNNIEKISIYASSTLKLIKLNLIGNLLLLNSNENFISSNKLEFFINEGHSIIKELLKNRFIDREYYKSLVSLFNSNLGLTYITIYKDYFKSINILENNIIRNENNTDYFNLARAYFEIKEYEKSLEFSFKALFTSHDEITLYLISQNLYHLNRTREALKYALMTQEIIVDFVIGNEHSQEEINIVDQTSEYSSFLIEPDKFLIDHYRNIVYIYMSLNDYELASYYIKEYLGKFPDSFEFKQLYKQIEILIDNKIDERIQIDDIEKSLVIAREQNSKLKEWNNKYKEISKQIIKVQNSLILTNSESDEERLLEHMHNIAEDMKRRLGKNDKQKISRLQSDFINDYPALNSKSIEMLATSEYLYTLTQTVLIDFSPIIVEYARVIENEVNLYLIKHKIIKRRLTLGQLGYKIKENNIEPFTEFNNFIEKIRKIRNECAHSGLSNLSKVNQIRSMLFDDDWLNKIMSLNTKTIK